jgi:hypothetical protein
MINYPKNIVEWWDLVNEHWDNLLLIMENYLPMNGYEDIEFNILSTTLREHIFRLRNTQDRELARYFTAAWAAAPDASFIHKISGWNVLCDLLAEEYILD